MKLNFTFHSPDHVRYENSKRVSGPHGGANRVVRVETDPKYHENFIVTIYNADGVHPLWQNNVQMSPKQMKIIEIDSNKIVLRGWGNDSTGEPFSNYGLIINLTNNEVSSCILRMYDRATYIKYLNQEELDDFNEFDGEPSIATEVRSNIYVENKIDGERTEWSMVNNMKHGVWKSFFSNGNPKEIGYCENGVNHGDWKAFNKNGSLRAYGKYEDGVQTGNWKFNDEEGNLRAEGNYIGGKQKGKWTYFDEHGSVEGSEIF